MTASGVRLGADGRLEVVRTAPPEPAARLRATAARLRSAAGAGAVEVIGFVDDGATVELVMAFAGRPPVAPMQGDELVAVAASTACHLADLHLRGIAHGALAAEHVLVDASGAVRLCGFADGGSPTDDVLALGQLLDALLDPDDHDESAERVRAVATRCTTEDTAARPTMAAIAASLASGPRAITARPSSTARPRRRPRLAIASAAAALAVGTVAVVAFGYARRDAPISAPTTTTSTTTATTSTVVRPTRVWPVPEIVDATGATWRFDRRGLVLQSDWDCDGVETPLLVDDDGVWVVDAWATDGDEIVTRLVTRVKGVIDAEVARGAPCDQVLLRTADGQTITLAVGARSRSPGADPDG